MSQNHKPGPSHQNTLPAREPRTKWKDFRAQLQLNVPPAPASLATFVPERNRPSQTDRRRPSTSSDFAPLVSSTPRLGDYSIPAPSPKGKTKKPNFDSRSSSSSFYSSPSSSDTLNSRPFTTCGAVSLDSDSWCDTWSQSPSEDDNNTHILNTLSKDTAEDATLVSSKTTRHLWKPGPRQQPASENFHVKDNHRAAPHKTSRAVEDELDSFIQSNIHLGVGVKATALDQNVFPTEPLYISKSPCALNHDDETFTQDGSTCSQHGFNGAFLPTDKGSWLRTTLVSSTTVDQRKNKPFRVSFAPTVSFQDNKVAPLSTCSSPVLSDNEDYSGYSSDSFNRRYVTRGKSSRSRDYTKENQTIDFFEKPPPNQRETNSAQQMKQKFLEKTHVYQTELESPNSCFRSAQSKLESVQAELLRTRQQYVEAGQENTVLAAQLEDAQAATRQEEGLRVELQKLKTNLETQIQHLEVQLKLEERNHKDTTGKLRKEEDELSLTCKLLDDSQKQLVAMEKCLEERESQHSDQLKHLSRIKDSVINKLTNECLVLKHQLDQAHEEKNVLFAEQQCQIKHLTESFEHTKSEAVLSAVRIKSQQLDSLEARLRDQETLLATIAAESQQRAAAVDRLTLDLALKSNRAAELEAETARLTQSLQEAEQRGMQKAKEMETISAKHARHVLDLEGKNNREVARIHAQAQSKIDQLEGTVQDVEKALEKEQAQKQDLRKQHQLKLEQVNSAATLCETEKGRLRDELEASNNQLQLKLEEGNQMQGRINALKTELEEKNTLAMALKTELAQNTNDLVELDTQVKRLAKQIKDTKHDDIRPEFEDALLQVLNMVRNINTTAPVRSLGFWKAAVPQSQQVFVGLFRDLEAATALLVQNVQRLEDHVKHMGKERDYLAEQRQTEMGEAKALILELKERNDHLTQEVEDVSADLNKLEQKHEKTVGQLKCSQNEVTKLEASVDVKLKQLKAKEVVNSELKKMADTKSLEIQELQKTHEKHGACIEALQRDIQAKESTIDLLVSDSKTKDTRIETLETQVEAEKNNAYKLEAKNTQLGATSTAQRDTIDALRAQIQEKAAALGATEARVTTLLASMEKLSSDNFELETQASKQACQVSALQSQVRTLKSKVVKLQSAGTPQMLYIDSFTPGVQPIGVTPEYAQTVIGDMLRMLKTYCAATASGPKQTPSGLARLMDPSQVSVFSLPLVVEKLLVAVATASTGGEGTMKKKKRVKNDPSKGEDAPAQGEEDA